MTTFNVDIVGAWVSWVLAIIANVRYGFGRASPWDHGHQYDVAFTPFTANAPLIWVLWILLIVGQLWYLIKAQPLASVQLNRHFIANNAAIFFWVILFARGHYFFSLLFIAASLLITFSEYLILGSYKLRPFKTWATVHVPVVVLPLVWAFYAVFWNGAVLFHARHLLSRLVANIFIWNFLFVPLFFVVVFNDWAVGLFFAHMAVALAVGQITVKVFALQWLFAFIIAGILGVATLVFAFVRAPFESGDQAPLLSEANNV